MHVVVELMGKVALCVEWVMVQGGEVLPWFGAMATEVGVEGILPYLMVLSLYRITEGSTCSLVPGE